MFGTVSLRTFKNKTFSGRLLCAAALIGAVCTGCTDVCYGWFKISRTDDHGLTVTSCDDAQPDGSVEAEAGTPDGSVGPEAGAETGVPDPAGPVVTSVTAAGSGCPADTATPTISRDGKSFTVAFTQFTGSVDESTSVAIKECALTISVAPDGRSYALQSLNLKGTGMIGEGANLRVTSSYFIQGNAVEDDKQEITLTGPYDQAFDLTHAYGDTAPATPCGLERSLRVSLSLRLLNSEPPTASTFTVNSAGDAAFRLVPCP